MSSQDEPPIKRRESRSGTRKVSTLSAEQLERKRANDREAQRLRRCAQPHASGFVTAVPSEEDGRDTILKPRNFRIAVAYRLGVPVLSEGILSLVQADH